MSDVNGARTETLLGTLASTALTVTKPTMKVPIATGPAIVASASPRRGMIAHIPHTNPTISGRAIVTPAVGQDNTTDLSNSHAGAVVLPRLKTTAAAVNTAAAAIAKSTSGVST